MNHTRTYTCPQCDHDRDCDDADTAACSRCGLCGVCEPGDGSSNECLRCTNERNGIRSVDLTAVQMDVDTVWVEVAPPVRTRIRSLSHQSASIQYHDCGENVFRVFYAAPEGGYVFFTDRLGNPSQICERLYLTGKTLRWYPSDGPLVDLIRREYRRREAALRRDTNR